MQLENFFDSISYICIKILPLLGVILAIYLIIMVHNLIKTLQSATKTLDEANNQIRKLDVPLNTVTEISKSVDQVHDLTKESLKSISTSLYQSLNMVKDKVNQLLHKEKNEEIKETVTNEIPKE